MSGPAVGFRGTVDERFLAKCAPPDENGCVRWLGGHNNNGYAMFTHDGRWALAHVFAWEQEYGPVPPGLELDHVAKRGCLYRDCVNPAHLEPVTHQENLLRGRNVNREKTHCAHGHPYTTENTYLRPEGGRRCRRCHVIRERRRHGRPERATA